MSSYQYKGRDIKGGLVTGVMEATDTGAVASALQQNNVIPLDIKLVVQAAVAKTPELRFFREKVSPLDIMMFSRQMHTLLKAGIPIMRALAGIQATTQNTVLAKVVGELRQALDAGRELSSAMAEHPEVFDNFYINMIRVGETTGMLDEIFLRMFHHLEFEKFMREQIKSALRYPSFVVTAMLAAIVVINIFVIPSFAKVFEGLHAELPFLTQLLLAFSNFMLKFWPLILLLGFIVIATFKRHISTPQGRLQWDTYKLRLPIAGKIIYKGTLARFARSFALASKSGVPIMSTLKLVAQTVDNEFVSRKVDGMCLGIERGESVSRTAIQAEVFNPLVLQMMAVGEESGALDDMMHEIAEMYQRDMEYEIKTLGSQIEPILIVFLGFIVLILALGIFLPVWDLGKVALHK